jgi:hypothetical protein
MRELLVYLIKQLPTIKRPHCRQVGSHTLRISDDEHNYILPLGGNKPQSSSFARKSSARRGEIPSRAVFVFDLA